MKKLDINKINFKKIIVTYIVFAVIAGLLSVGFLGFIFKDKLILAYNYKQISEKVEDNESGIKAVKPELSALAEKSSDIVDILILNSENKIIFTAKNSDLAKNGNLELESRADRENRYLTDKANPDVYFKLVKNDSLFLLKAMVSSDNEVEQQYNDDYFYEDNFNAKEVYLLSYTIDKSSGNKIYFISDIQPVANGEIYVKAVAAIAILFFMLYWVLIALWAYANAKKSKLNAVIWGIITLFTNLAGLFIYFIYKQINKTCYKCGMVQRKTNIYCTSCGTKIGETCENCHTVINNKEGFCKNCGSEINRK